MLSRMDATEAHRSAVAGLVPKAQHALASQGLDPDDRRVAACAAVGAAFVTVLARLAVEDGGMPRSTFEAIETCCGMAVEAFTEMAAG